MPRPRTIPDPSEELRDELYLLVRVCGEIREAGRRLQVPRRHLEAWMRRDKAFRDEMHFAKDCWKTARLRLIAEFITRGDSTRSAAARVGLSREWVQDQVRYSAELRDLIERARERRDGRERVHPDPASEAGRAAGAVRG